MTISYHKEDVDFVLPKEELLTQWLEGLASEEGKKILQVSYVFCHDAYLLKINKEYLNHDYYTDIITFPYKQGKEIESDIFISTERIEENATLYASTFELELLRVMAHGVLHLMGYADKTEAEQQTMRKMEDQAIEKFLTLRMRLKESN